MSLTPFERSTQRDRECHARQSAKARAELRTRQAQRDENLRKWKRLLDLSPVSLPDTDGFLEFCQDFVDTAYVSLLRARGLAKNGSPTLAQKLLTSLAHTALRWQHLVKLYLRHVSG